MILDKNDPTGMGLFSRCARNQACKITKSRPQTASSKPSVQKQIFKRQQIELKRKNTISQKNSFSRQQSRQQRQKKFKHDPTPPVGQYNPTFKQKPKFVWDILKLYQKKNKQVKKRQQMLQINRQKHQALSMNGTGFKKTQHKTLQQNKAEQLENNKNNSNSIYDKFLEEGQQKENHKTVSPAKPKYQNIGSDDGEQYEVSRYRQKTTMSTKSQCVVNMSRMTGRVIAQSPYKKAGHVLGSQSQYIDNTDLNSTIDHVKSKVTKNIYFKKMIGRKDSTKKVGTANIYDCNIDLIRPKTASKVDFASTQGRNVERRKDESAFSYIHYDYNSYVWKSNSSIYPNTKRGLIPFQKQRGKS